MPQIILGIFLAGVLLNVLVFGVPTAINWYEVSLSSYTPSAHWYSYPWNWPGSYLVNELFILFSPVNEKSINIGSLSVLLDGFQLFMKAILAMAINIYIVIVPLVILRFVVFKSIIVGKKKELLTQQN